MLIYFLFLILRVCFYEVLLGICQRSYGDIRRLYKCGAVGLMPGMRSCENDREKLGKRVKIQIFSEVFRKNNL